MWEFLARSLEASMIFTFAALGELTLLPLRKSAANLESMSVERVVADPAHFALGLQLAVLVEALAHSDEVLGRYRRGVPHHPQEVLFNLFVSHMTV